MKKLAILIFLFIFMPTISIANTTYFAIDETIDLSNITGFQMDIVDQEFDLSNEANLRVWYQGRGDVLTNGLKSYSGAVPDFSGIWDIYIVNNPFKGVGGMDNTFGSFPLTSGVIFEIDAVGVDIVFDESSFFFMRGFGNKDTEVNLLSETLSDGSLLFTASQVPIPSSLLLLGCGIFAVAGISRRKK